MDLICALATRWDLTGQHVQDTSRSHCI